jgi:hypothetical protein
VHPATPTRKPGSTSCVADFPTALELPPRRTFCLVARPRAAPPS